MGRNKLFPPTLDPEQERKREVIYDHMCRHLVCLCVRFTRLDAEGKSDGLERLSHSSFFVAAVGGDWYLVTAGHVLKDLDEVYRRGGVRVESTFLADFFGNRKTVNIPTPFPYEPGMGFSVDDPETGVDFGCIPLRDFYKVGLAANGIVPLSDLHWTRPADPELRAYWMLGFPADVNRPYNEPVRAGAQRNSVAAPVIVSLDRLTEADVPVEVPNWRTPTPRFIGRINVGITFGIRGMSGGPIFGICRLPSGFTGYTVVALQSRWHAPTRTIFGCPVRVFGELLATESRRRAAERPA